MRSILGERVERLQHVVRLGDLEAEDLDARLIVLGVGLRLLLGGRGQTQQRADGEQRERAQHDVVLE